jgi:uncharacterized protein HemY
MITPQQKRFNEARRHLRESIEALDAALKCRSSADTIAELGTALAFASDIYRIEEIKARLSDLRV